MVVDRRICRLWVAFLTPTLFCLCVAIHSPATSCSCFPVGLLLPSQVQSQAASHHTPSHPLRSPIAYLPALPPTTPPPIRSPFGCARARLGDVLVGREEARRRGEMEAPDFKVRRAAMEAFVDLKEHALPASRSDGDLGARSQSSRSSEVADVEGEREVGFLVRVIPVKSSQKSSEGAKPRIGVIRVSRGKSRSASEVADRRTEISRLGARKEGWLWNGFGQNGGPILVGQGNGWKLTGPKLMLIGLLVVCWLGLKARRRF